VRGCRFAQGSLYAQLVCVLGTGTHTFQTAARLLQCAVGARRLQPLVECGLHAITLAVVCLRARPRRGSHYVQLLSQRRSGRLRLRRLCRRGHRLLGDGDFRRTRFLTCRFRHWLAALDLPSARCTWRLQNRPSPRIGGAPVCNVSWRRSLHTCARLRSHAFSEPLAP